MPTVLIATLNGEATLPPVLEQYCRLQAPAAGWKMVIVDNGSTDRTKEVISSFLDRLPITYVFEPILGKNNALNTGLSHIAGDLLVFSDDDVFPRSDWLIRLCEAADSLSSYSIFAGLILPRWEVAPPDWILRMVPLTVTYGIQGPETREGPTAPHNAFGGNLAIRTDIFRKGYRFDPSIGPRGASYPTGSETQLVRQLVKDGCAIWYCERAVVEHLIPRSHFQKEWILRRAVRYGRGQYRLTHSESALPKWWNVPRWIFRAMLNQMIKIGIAAVTRNAQQLFRAQWELSYLRGVAIEARVIGKTQPTHPRGRGDAAVRQASR
jgi:glycosyltransferase involved in cell wall biosynthesis